MYQNLADWCMRGLCSFIFRLLIVFGPFICHGQNGIVVTEKNATRGIVSFSSSSVITGISNSKHIDGYVKKYGSSTFIFPVGDNGSYRPFAASADGTVGAYFQQSPSTTAIPSGGPFVIDRKSDDLAAISNKEFWDIDGTNATQITLTWNAASDVGALTSNKLDVLTIVGWNSSTAVWEKIVSSVDAGSITGGQSSVSAGSITTTANIVPNNYQIYTLAAIAAGPLPVKLIQFNVSVRDSRDVNLSWETASEVNSERFDIERSPDGESWSTIGTVKSKGESNTFSYYRYIDSLPFPNRNYYRLRMIDMDQSSAYSHIQTVVISEISEVVVYPNPVSDKLFINANGLSKVVIYDSHGRVISLLDSDFVNGIQVSGFSPGGYLVIVHFKSGKTSAHKIIITN